MKLLAFNQRRSKFQMLTWWGLPLVMVGGWFYPMLGYLLLGCMLGAIGIAFFRGRAWCDWMCPRGAFFDLILQKISPKKKVPQLFNNLSFRIFMIVLMMTALVVQIYYAWPDANLIGLAFVRLLTITTAAGVVLGIFYQQRVWCHICPMGTSANFISKGKLPLTVKDSCVDCKACAKVCPMQLNPSAYKNQGVMDDPDCIKCSTCVAACPKDALEFAATKKAA